MVWQNTAMLDPATLHRILVIKLRHHGDVLLSAPVLSALRRIAPQSEIDALVYADTGPLIAGHPALAHLHAIDRDWKRLPVLERARAEWRLFHALWRRNFDLIVHLSVHNRGAWLVRLLRPRWSVAPKRSGSASIWHHTFSNLYAAQSSPDRHTVESNLDALRALGLEVIEADRRVELVPGPEAETRADTMLAALGLSHRRFVHCHPASRWGFKVWPAEKVAAMCDALAGEGWPIVLTAAPDPRERALVAAVCAATRHPVHDLSGQFSLRELAALIARARLFVGVDSAPMHIAAAMDTPTVGIFGPSGDREWGPWDWRAGVGGRHRVVASQSHPCRPCGRAGCDDSRVSECLTTLSPDPVLAACRQLLN